MLWMMHFFVTFNFCYANFIRAPVSHPDELIKVSSTPAKCAWTFSIEKISTNFTGKVEVDSVYSLTKSFLESETGNVFCVTQKLCAQSKFTCEMCCDFSPITLTSVTILVHIVRDNSELFLILAVERNFCVFFF